MLAKVKTLPKQGAVHATKDNCEIYSTKHITAIDTTGPGDTFNGALAYALTQNKPLNQAIIFARDAITIAVSKIGAQLIIPTVNELEKFQRNNQ